MHLGKGIVDRLHLHIGAVGGGERPFTRYGEGSGFSRQAPKAAKKTQPSALIINLAEERARRAKRLK